MCPRDDISNKFSSINGNNYNDDHDDGVELFDSEEDYENAIGQNYDDEYDYYEESPNKYDREFLSDFKGPKKPISKALLIFLLLLLTIGICAAAYYFLPTEEYAYFAYVLTTNMLYYQGFVWLVFILIGIALAISYVYFEKLDIAITWAYHPDDMNSFTIKHFVSCLFMGSSLPQSLVFNRDDKEKYLKFRLAITWAKFIFKYLCLIIAILSFVGILMPSKAQGEYWKMTDMLMVALMFVLPNIDSFVYALIKLMPMYETFKCDVTYERTTYDDYGNKHTSQYTREETGSTGPIILICGLAYWALESLLFLNSSAVALCRIIETNRVNNFLNKYDDASSIRDYFELD